MCIAMIAPQHRNRFAEPKIEMYVDEWDTIMIKFSGIAVDDYEDVYKRKATVSELRKFFSNVYYGDKNVSIRMNVEDIFECKDESNFPKFMLELSPTLPRNPTQSLVVYSNTCVFVILDETGFHPCDPSNIPFAKYDMRGRSHG